MQTSRLAYLFETYVAGTISTEEQDELMLLLADRENKPEADALISSIILVKQPTHKIDSRNAEDILHAIFHSENLAEKIKRATVIPPILSTPDIHRSSRPIYRYAAVAAAILITVTGYILWSGNKANNRMAFAPAQAHTDIPAGKEGALLTLSDGRRIVLDSLGNGLVANQNGTTITLENGILAYNATDATNGQTVYNSIATPRARLFHMMLPDGSKVWLNAASSIRYPTAFPATERVVEIQGEAYFEIAKNAGSPFKVKVNGETSIDVLGTSFNINSYENEDDIRTTLIDGSVKFNTGRQSQLMKAGQQAIFRRTGTLTLVDNPDMDKASAWRTGFFNFDDAGLREVMRQLERWYDIDVVYENNVTNVEFSGMIDRKVSLLTILNTLGKSGVHFRMEGRKVIVYP